MRALCWDQANFEKGVGLNIIVSLVALNSLIFFIEPLNLNLYRAPKPTLGNPNPKLNGFEAPRL